MASRKGVFVTGTDTDVGKTEVGRAAIASLRAGGLSVGVMKPIETGVGKQGPLDAKALKEAAGVDDPLGDICPQQFALPASPDVAARDEGRTVDLEAILRAYQRIGANRDFVWVEGAGGLLVPTTSQTCMADLARTLELPVLLVARAALGTINHTLLSLAELERQKLPCVGVVISHSGGPLSPAEAKNLSGLKARLGTQLLGELPPIQSGAAPPDWLDLDRLIG
jgi:dethiobiotin synthetase